jgi:uncharacterized protein with NRDE domain
MCLIVLAFQAHPRFRLAVAANRDEAYARPTAPASWWPDAPDLLAGRDLRDGGTWMGVTRGGRFAAVTNYREMTPPRPNAPSRGHLVDGFLRSAAAPMEYLAELAGRAGEYNGFNLLVGDGDALAWLSNRGDGPHALQPGIYGLSNALLDTPWPKVVRAREQMRAVLDGSEEDVEPGLFRLLAERDPAPDTSLPDTGVGLERERALSSLFISSPMYGTRSSTVLLVRGDGRATFTERRVTPGAEEMGESRFDLAFPAAERANA